MAIDRRRRALYGKIEIARKDLAIDEDTYRDLLDARYGKRSRTELADAQLVDLVEHFKSLGFKPRPPRQRGGGRALADSDTGRKMRALWLALWNLGEVRNPDEAALAAFVKRQARVDAIQFLGPNDAHKVIEALKQMAERKCAVDWGEHRDPRRCVIAAQWRNLVVAGAIHHADAMTAESFGYRVTGKAAFHFYEPADFDKLADALGRMFRSHRKETEDATT